MAWHVSFDDVDVISALCVSVFFCVSVCCVVVVVVLCCCFDLFVCLILGDVYVPFLLIVSVYMQHVLLILVVV